MPGGAEFHGAAEEGGVAGLEVRVDGVFDELGLGDRWRGGIVAVVGVEGVLDSDVCLSGGDLGGGYFFGKAERRPERISWIQLLLRILGLSAMSSLPAAIIMLITARWVEVSSMMQKGHSVNVARTKLGNFALWAPPLRKDWGRCRGND